MTQRTREKKRRRRKLERYRRETHPLYQGMIALRNILYRTIDPAPPLLLLSTSEYAEYKEIVHGS